MSRVPRRPEAVVLDYIESRKKTRLNMNEYYFKNNFTPFIEKEEEKDDVGQLFISLKAFYFMKSDELKLLHLVNCQVLLTN